MQISQNITENITAHVINKRQVNAQPPEANTKTPITPPNVTSVVVQGNAVCEI